MDLKIPWLHIALNFDTNRTGFYHPSTWTRGYSAFHITIQFSLQILP
jgi:hypothetical protein